MINIKTNDWQIENIDTVLFDKDGTLIDLHHFWGKMTLLRTQAVIEKYNIKRNMKDYLCKCLGYDVSTEKMYEDGITALYSRPKIIEIFNKDLNNIGINSTQNEIEKIFDDVSCEFNKNISKYTKPIDSAVNFAKKLSELDIKLGIVTSDSLESTQLTIKQYGWQNLFKIIVGRESSQFSKESGALTKLALEGLNSDPNNTVMIGDAPMDAISAKNAGVKSAILVASGQVTENILCQNSKYIVNDLSNLIVNKCNNKS